jgi:hypothetical protein
MYADLSVGADPEIFFQKNGSPKSVEGMLGGTKHEPKPMFANIGGFYVQEDNVAAEFNIPPAKTPQGFYRNITRGLTFLERQAKKKGCSLLLQDSAHFSEKELDTPHAQELGCEPDYNVWTMNPNPRPLPPRTLRTAAGHVHIGYKNPQMEDRILLGKACDLFLGIPSVLEFPKTERRTLYGKAGAVRFKPYGIEYRTLPNYWIGNKKQIFFVFETVQKICAELSYNPEMYTNIFEEVSEDIQTVINNSDVFLANKLCNDFSLNLFPR